MAKKCLLEGCKYPQFGGGYCKSHQWKRDDIIRETKKISDTLEAVLPEYHDKVRAYLETHTECNIKVPGVCTFFAGCVNHTRGRESVKQLLNENDWEASCYPCNGWIENNHAWAEERGHKKKRHGHYKRSK